MDAFVWERWFETGLAGIDDQHRQLVSLINRFGDLVSHGEVPPGDLDDVLLQLVEYARLHFREEENLMVEAGLDPQQTDAHRALHVGFLEQVVLMRDQGAPGDLGSAQHLLRFLTHWLAHHILGHDQSMARQIAVLRENALPSTAAAAGPSRVPPATTALLHALDGLFREVTERNAELLSVNRTLEARVDERTRELRAANATLESLSLTDPLTGLPNRRHATARLEREWSATSAAGAPLACLLIDADHFKEVNDTHGHEAGDAVLRDLARTLAHTARSDDIVGRLGGDEFIVVCPRTPLDGALALAETLREVVALLRSGPWVGSVSIGVAVRTPEMTRIEDLVRMADEGVYVAKRKGRNAVGCVLPTRDHLGPASERPTLRACSPPGADPTGERRSRASTAPAS